MKFGNRRDILEITLEGVTCIEDGVTWFEDVDHTFKAGDNVWLKGELVMSHMLKVLAGLTKPKKGRVYFNGIDIHEMDFEEFLPFRLNIGYTFNLGGILNNRTLKENLMLPFLYHGAPLDFAQKEVQQIIDLLGLGRYQDHRPAGVPGVFRKLTCVGRALATTPQVLLMDDPTSSMKAAMVKGLHKWIAERRREYPVFVLASSDHLDEVFEDKSYQVLTVEDGKIVLQKPNKAAG